MRFSDVEFRSTLRIIRAQDDPRFVTPPHTKDPGER